MGGHFLFIISCYQWLADPLCWLQIGYKNSKDAMENEKYVNQTDKKRIKSAYYHSLLRS